MAEDEDTGTLLIAELYKPPALLPIAQLKDPLLYAIETYPVTIVVGFIHVPFHTMAFLVIPEGC